MNFWLTVREVANLEGITERAVQKRVREAKFDKLRQVESCRGGGKCGKVWQVHLSCLSPAAQAIYLRNHAGEIGTRETLGEVPMELRAQALLDYSSAPDWSREIAHLRYEVLQAFEQFKAGQRGPRRTGRRGQGRTPGRFIQQYQRRALPVSDEVYEKIPRLTVGTLYRWQEAFRAHGVAGLLSRHGHNGSRGLTPKHQEFVVGLIHQNPTIRAARVSDYLFQKFQEVPHLSTIYRFMNRWKRENRQLYTWLKNPEEWKNKYQVAFGREDAWATHFCHGWEMDTTPADVICSDNKRYSCLLNIDVFSRRAMVLISETSKATAIAALMRRGILEWGIPEVIVKDNGKDYTSRHIEAICATFEIDTPFVPAYTPEAKGIVERFCKTLAVGLFEELPGFCGHNVAERQAIRAKERALVRQFMTPGAAIKVPVTSEQLQAFVDSWVRHVYEQRPHDGIGGLTPVQRAAQSSKPVRRIEDERVLDILLAPGADPTVQKKGIRYQGGWYQSFELVDHTGEKVQIREDLQDAGRVYVFDHAGRYICTAVDEALAGFSVEDYRKARREQKRRMRQADRALAQIASVPESPMISLLEGQGEEPGRVVPLVRKETARLDAADQALRAAQDQEEKTETAVPLHQEDDEPEDGLFYGPDHRSRRYRYLMKKLQRGEAFTDQERAFLEDYVETREWWLLFGEEDAEAL